MTVALSGQGVGMVVVPSVKSAAWTSVIDVCSKDRRFYFGLGLHPYAINEHDDKCMLQLSLLLKKLRQEKVSKLVAIGEIGLDFTCPHPQKQVGLFEEQLRLAEEYQLPVIIHVRKAHAEVLAILKKYRLAGGVVHAFSGSFELMMSYIQLGLKIGVGPVITWPRSLKTRASIALAPIESLVLETDSPDMAIAGFKSGQGTPLDVHQVFLALKDIRAESGDVLERVLWETSQKLFLGGQ